MTKKEKQTEIQLLNIEQLVNNIARDIVNLSQGVGKAKVTRDLKSLDLSSFIPEGRTTALKGIISQLKTEGEKVKQQQQEQIQIQSEALEKSIKTRQENMKLNLSKLQKAGTRAKTRDIGKIVEKRVADNIKRHDRNIEELNIQKRTSPANIWTEADISERIKPATAKTDLPK